MFVMLDWILATGTEIDPPSSGYGEYLIYSCEIELFLSAAVLKEGNISGVTLDSLCYVFKVDSYLEEFLLFGELEFTMK